MKPQFETLQDFIAMGGYGFYVWAAWGLSLAVILFLTFGALIGERQTLKRLQSLEKAGGDLE